MLNHARAWRAWLQEIESIRPVARVIKHSRRTCGIIWRAHLLHSAGHCKLTGACCTGDWLRADVDSWLIFKASSASSQEQVCCVHPLKHMSYNTENHKGHGSIPNNPAHFNPCFAGLKTLTLEDAWQVPWKNSRADNIGMLEASSANIA